MCGFRKPNYVVKGLERCSNQPRRAIHESWKVHIPILKNLLVRTDAFGTFEREKTMRFLFFRKWQ